MGSTGAPYNIPWPEYPEAADGPDAFKDQAEALAAALATQTSLTASAVAAAEARQSRMNKVLYGSATPNAGIAVGSSGVNWGVLSMVQPAGISLEIKMQAMVTTHITTPIANSAVIVRARAGSLSMLGPDWSYADVPPVFANSISVDGMWILPAVGTDRTLTLGCEARIREGGATRRLDQIFIWARPINYASDLFV